MCPKVSERTVSKHRQKPSLIRKRAFLAAAAFLLAAVLLLYSSSAFAEPQIRAKAAILIDAQSGQVLWEKNSSTPLPPASTGKIITAITAMDMAAGDTLCTISSTAANVGESSINLTPGMQYTLDDLLQGALVRSGNDACYAIGENIAGFEPLFVHWLNLKAATLGAWSANLLNTNGLPAKGHTISAHDLALAARYAMRNERFAEIVSLRYAKIGAGSTARSLKNTNKLLWQDESVKGIKTGTTDDAGACLVSYMEKNNLKLISVVFDSPDRYGESSRILGYGADSYLAGHLTPVGGISAYLPVHGGEQKILKLVAANDGYFLYPSSAKDQLHFSWELPQYAEAPIFSGAPLGKIKILGADDKVVAEVELLAANDVPEANFWDFLAIGS